MTENEKNVIKGLKCCSQRDISACKDCPYKSGDNCFDMCKGAYELIERLSAELEAAKRDFRQVGNNTYSFDACPCDYCKYADGDCSDKRHGTCFEWRGLCAENGGMQ